MLQNFNKNDVFIESMKLHHIGYACENINNALNFVKKLYPVKTVSEIVYDSLQKATLCLITLEDGHAIELVSGEPVKHLLNIGINLYHICYEVNDLNLAIKQFKEQGGTQIGEIYPAKLFNERNVVFIQTDIGLIELLENKLSNNHYKILLVGTFSTVGIQESLFKWSEKLTLPYVVESLPDSVMDFELIDEKSLFNNNTGINILLVRMVDYSTCEKTDAFIKNLKISASYCLAKIIVCVCPSYENEFLYKKDPVVLIKNAIKNYSNIIFVDLSKKLTKEESSKIYDAFSEQEAKLPYTEYFDIGFSLMLLKKIYGVIHNNYKVLVVDCDNTLWTGVCAENQINEISLSDANIFLQKKLVSLHKKGFIIIVCSKNTETDVRNVFKNHPDMLLSEQHVTAWKVNWASKHENIKKIASTLNLPLSSFIFIDDNLIECHEVELFLPEVLTINYVNEYRSLKKLLNDLWAFEKTIVSKQSSNRAIWYENHLEREKIKDRSTSLKEFIDSLDLEIKISCAELEDINRISELSYRVTQFNFSNRSYSENTIKAILLNEPGVIKVDLSDKYGNYGTVGGIIIEQKDDHLFVVALFLSCRALNRGVEYEMVNFLGKLADSLNLQYIIFEFKETCRNLPAKQFLDFLSESSEKKANPNLFYKISTDRANNVKFSPDFLDEKAALQDKHEGRVDKNICQINPQKIKALSGMTSSWDSAYSFMKNASYSKESNNQELITSASLKKIWADVLDLDYENIEDNANFFELGGTSLLALRLLSKIHANFLIELKLYEIFKFPIFSDFYYQFFKKNVFSLEKKKLLPKLTLKKSSGYSETELAANQKSLWLIDKLYENSWFYNISSVYKISGDLKETTFKEAIIQIIHNNESLRSFVKSNSHEPLLAIDSSPNFFNIEILNCENQQLEKLEELINTIQLEPFNLNTYPLYRIRLLKIEKNSYIFIIVFHHIIFDGWSEGLFNKQLSHFYSNAINNSSPQKNTLRYSDYIDWEKQLSSLKIYEDSLNYWTNELKDIKYFNFPTSFSRQNKNHHKGKYHYFSLPPSVNNQLFLLKKETNTTLFCLLYAAFIVVLHQISKIEDIVIGIPVSGRLIKEFENIIGNFVSTLPMRINVNGNMSIAQFIEKCHKKIFEAYENQFVPFSEMVKHLPFVRMNGSNPIYQIMFVLQDAENQKLSLDNMDVDFYKRGYDAARMDLTLEINWINNKLDGGIYYDTALFSESFIEEIIETYKDILLLITEPTNLHKNLETLFDIKYHYIKDKMLLCEKFQQSTIFFPKNIAIKYKEKTLTYQKLNAQSNQLANYLSDLGIKINDKVVLHLLRSPDIIIAILACFKIGAAYIPLDPEYPEDYKKKIIDDCQPQCLITNSTINEKLHSTILNLYEIENSLQKQPLDLKVDNNVNPATVAYIMYTSGTTGKPKGVVISHYSISVLIKSLENIYHHFNHDVGLLFHSFCFDVSVWEIWSVLSCGGKLIISEKPSNYTAKDFWLMIQKENVTLLSQTPTVFENYLSNISLSSIKNISLRLLIFAGEKLSPKILLPWLKVFGENRPEIYNMYGITETTVYSTYQKINLEIAKSNCSLIGQAIDGTKIALLNENFEYVESGAVGEIYLSGSGLAQGYLNNQELNTKYFININNETWYRSGDLGKRVENGNIEYVGRKDNDIKVRGYRIEPYYIANVIEENPFVSRAVVWINRETQSNTLLAVISSDDEFSLPINNYLRTIQQKPELIQKSVILPNGMQIFQHNHSETALQYQEIFIDKEYLKHNIVVEHGDVIVDVGANIGMFSLLFGRYLEGIKIYAIEPVPELFDILKSNLWLYGIDAKCFNYGISNIKEVSDFSYYPYASVLSGKNTSRNEVRQLIANTASNEIDNEEIEKLVQATSYEKKIKCEFLPLSEFIESQRISRINLLKIDVERSEFLVLEGIRLDQWKIIDQIVIEVHKFDNNCERIIELLEQHNFIIQRDTPKILNNTDIIVLYARKNQFIEKNSNNNFLSSKPKYVWENQKALISDIKGFLKQKLPAYMIPAKIKISEKIPYNINGKVDLDVLNERFALELNDNATSPHSSFSKMEERIKKIWNEVLKIDITDSEANFFDYGGDSFLLLQLHNRICSEISTVVQLIDLFEYTTIKKQEEFLNRLINGERNEHH